MNMKEALTGQNVAREGEKKRKAMDYGTAHH